MQPVLRGILAGTFALSLSSCSGPDPADIDEKVVRPVKTFEVGSTDGNFNREWPGRIEPTQNAEMSFTVAGDIVELPIEEGATVERGQLLARIDARQFRARLDREQAQLRFDQTEYERSAKLVASGAVARAELDRRTRALEVSKATVVEARKALDDTKLLAPFTGVIAKISVDNFQSVQAKQPVLVLQDASSLEVVTHVSQRDYAAATPGLTIEQRNQQFTGDVRATLDTHPDLQIPARLKEVASVPDPITGTYEVTWSFDPPEGVTITPGMTAKIVLTNLPAHAQPAAGPFVPIEAVVGSDEGGTHVWMIDPDSWMVSRVDVEIGGLSGDSIQITSGLEGGELLATTGVHSLREGMTVSSFEELYGDVERAR
jgi:membrane fusion protein, multidrug efflux system